MGKFSLPNGVNIVIKITGLVILVIFFCLFLITYLIETYVSTGIPYQIIVENELSRVTFLGFISVALTLGLYYLLIKFDKISEYLQGLLERRKYSKVLRSLDEYSIKIICSFFDFKDNRFYISQQFLRAESSIVDNLVLNDIIYNISENKTTNSTEYYISLNADFVAQMNRAIIYNKGYVKKLVNKNYKIKFYRVEISV